MFCKDHRKVEYGQLRDKRYHGSDLTADNINIAVLHLAEKIGIISKLPVQVGVYCQLAACDFRNLYRYQLIKGGAGGAFCGRVCQDQFDGIQIPVFGGVNIGGSFISCSAGHVAGGCSVGRRGRGGAGRIAAGSQ